MQWNGSPRTSASSTTTDRAWLDFAALQRFRDEIDTALPVAQLAGLRARFEAEALLPAIARDAAALVDRLHADGLLTLVVSATRQALVQLVANQLGIAHVIGSDSQPELDAHASAPARSRMSGTG